MVIVRWRWCIEVVAIYYVNDIFGDKSMRNVFFLFRWCLHRPQYVYRAVKSNF